MRIIILFYVVLFFCISQVYALPLLGVIPFVFDFSILFLVFIFGLLNTIIFYLFKKIKILNIILLLMGLILELYLFYLIGFEAFKDININLINGYYINYVFLLFIIYIFSIFLFFLAKKFNLFLIEILLSLILITIIGVNINLLKDTISLKNRYNMVIEDLNKKVNNSIQFTSDLILNNILVSRDFIYFYKGKRRQCRITLSYYKHTNSLGAYATNAPKTSKIHLYTGLSERKNGKSLCRYLIEGGK